jgi:uncharacterized protein (DUF58 family)
MLDCGRLMTAESLGLSQLDHVLNAVLMLAHVVSDSGKGCVSSPFDAYCT